MQDGVVFETKEQVVKEALGPISRIMKDPQTYERLTQIY